MKFGITIPKAFQSLILSQNKDAVIDKIYYCPHHPNADVKSYRVDCECRKPKPGLLLQIAHRFNVDPTEMLVIGDSMRDLLAAKACKAAAVLVKTGKGMETLKAEIDVPIYADLAEAVDLFIINN